MGSLINVSSNLSNYMRVTRRRTVIKGCTGSSVVPVTTYMKVSPRTFTPTESWLPV